MSLTPAQIQARKNLNIPIDPDHRIIISLDGGGCHDIITLHMLAKIEEIAGIPIYEFADMLTGVSAGSVLSGLIAGGKRPARRVFKNYRDWCKVIFKPRLFATPITNIPVFSLCEARQTRELVLGNITLKESVLQGDVDLCLPTLDVYNDTGVFQTCIKDVDGKIVGPYQNILTRAAIETSGSFPVSYTHLTLPTNRAV